MSSTDLTIEALKELLQEERRLYHSLSRQLSEEHADKILARIDAEKAQKQLRQLLNFIIDDGGSYLLEHGVEKTIAQAMKDVNNMRRWLNE